MWCCNSDDSKSTESDTSPIKKETEITSLQKTTDTTKYNDLTSDDSNHSSVGKPKHKLRIKPPDASPAKKKEAIVKFGEVAKETSIIRAVGKAEKSSVHRHSNTATLVPKEKDVGSSNKSEAKQVKDDAQVNIHNKSHSGRSSQQTKDKAVVSSSGGVKKHSSSSSKSSEKEKVKSSDKSQHNKSENRTSSEKTHKHHKTTHHVSSNSDTKLSTGKSVVAGCDTAVNSTTVAASLPSSTSHKTKTEHHSSNSSHSKHKSSTHSSKQHSSRTSKGSSSSAKEQSKHHHSDVSNDTKSDQRSATPVQVSKSPTDDQSVSKSSKDKVGEKSKEKVTERSKDVVSETSKDKATERSKEGVISATQLKNDDRPAESKSKEEGNAAEKQKLNEKWKKQIENALFGENSSDSDSMDTST